MAEMLTKTDIVQALKGMGIKQGDELEVHSSLRSFGYVDGGAETVIAALKECCGKNGSIFMPALRLSPNLELTESDRQMGIVTKVKILPEDCEKSAMGAIADRFRNQSDTKTGSGIFRISGWGRNAGKAVEGGLDYVIHNGGKALLLGVDIYKLTAMHYVEDALPTEIGAIFAPGEMVNEKYPPSEWLIETGEPPVKAWYTIQSMAYERNLIQDGYIGTCKAMLFRIWDVVSLYQQELQKNPFKLYGLE